VLALWKQGEKVLVFCHFRATGRALERHLSAAFSAYFLSEVARRTGCDLADAERRLENLRSAYDAERSVRSEFDAVMTRIVSDFPELNESERTRVTEAARSLVRTPSFLVRYFPLEVGRRQTGAFERAIKETDGSGLSLQRKLRDFVEFLARRCSGDEREKYLEAVETIRLGERNVRLVNGGTSRQARQNLMLTFNSPFFPEVLVASAVLAEGVDLHRYCRYVIHHDLCWNPSTLEQRTGRIDRINAKAEQVKQPIHVYLPYLAGTQDEKMFRVVRDRERWFQVIMGENYRVDEKWGQEISERVPLPEAAARELAFRLEVWQG
jgi:superfamily II DNA or RNA helicase